LHIFALPKELSEAVEKLAQQHGVTMFMVLLAAYQAVLARWSGQQDVVVGTPISGRTHRQTEGLIGFFVNTLALRARLDQANNFEALLQQVKETVLSADAHQDLPFEKLVQELAPERDLSRQAIFQVWFVLQQKAKEEGKIADLQLRSISGNPVTAKFDLTLEFHETSDGLKGAVEYATDLFDASTIERFVGHLASFLEQVTTQAQMPLHQIDILTATERDQLLHQWNQWNDAQVEFPQGLLHTLIEEQAQRTPDAPAASFAGQQLTYAQLDRRANQLAQHLCHLGVRPESVIALCMPRSLEMIIAILGVLKAGAAYLPIDPSAPPERIAFMLQDMRVPIMLSHSSLEEQLPSHASRVIFMDLDWPQIARRSEDAPVVNVRPQNTAYVIYTSGSTGQPKGVMISHESACSLAESHRHMFGVRPGERVLQFARLSFDASVWEMLMALPAGATLCMIAEDDLGTLHQTLREQKINLATLPPSTLGLLKADELPDLHTLIVAGESCPLESARAMSVGRRFINAYGPTETTVCATAMTIRPDAGSIPIGQAIPNAQTYILDAHLNVAPIGVVGELYVGGKGLARGYLKRSALTAQRFIANPFGTDGGRLYRTGDLARYLSDGNIEFLGRIDHQVKIRGFRVEPGEIEARLLNHPEVREAAVIVREDTPGDQRLVAYVISAGNALLDPAVLREHLTQKLPDYMVPGAFVQLDVLPMTPNGKLDRAALPKPDLQGQANTQHAEARTQDEQALAQIWAQVLKLPKVGIHDDFFNIGGHSLLATQVISRIREIFALEIPLRGLFEARTIAQFAHYLDKAKREKSGVLLPELVAESRSANLPLSYSQERLWFLEQMGMVGSTYNASICRHVIGELDAHALERSFKELVRRHESLRTHFETVNGQGTQVIDSAESFSIRHVAADEVACQPGESLLQSFARQEMQRPFDLAQGPLFRVSLLRISASEHGMVLGMHHIITDAWSNGVMMRELASLYEAYAHGRPSPLADLEVQYADYAIWQRNWLTGPALQRQLTYWTEQLVDAPRVLELPTDRLRPAVPSYRGALHIFALPKELSEAVEKLAQQHGVTMFMVLLAAYQAVLARWSGQQDVVVGTPISGRTHRQTEGLIGFFVNTLALRARLDQANNFEALLQQVKETVLSADAHQDLPFEKLVQELAPERDLSRQAIFQVWFVLQQKAKEEAGISGLRLQSVPGSQVASKFDLTLIMHESDEGLRGALEYAVDLYDESTMARFSGHLVRFLEQVTTQPQMPLRQVDILTTAERNQLVHQWNQQGNAQTEVPQGFLHTLIEEQAQRTPDAPAVLFAGKQLSYAQLDRQANQLAQHLCHLGVRPESVIALCMPRSLEMIVAILGVLKAGAAYLPIDPSAPPERIAFMLQDTRVPIMLSHSSLEEQLPSHASRVIFMDLDWPQIARRSEDAPVVNVRPQNTAYVIYTSGSTGQPKGVMISHESATASLNARIKHYGATPPVMLLIPSISFDSSIASVFWTLALGGALAIPDDSEYRDVARLSQIAKDNQVTHWLSTPSLYEALFQASEYPRHLQTVVVAGEELTRSVAHRHFQKTPQAQLHNEYGPTEVAVWSTVAQLQASEFAAAEEGTVSIGRPISNRRAYVLDEHLNIAPIGVAGELYLSGIGLARGYLKRAALTSQRFIANPFEGAGDRLYRTGDLVRYLPDGDIEFLGRTDQQVKIRGYRIEPGEIEAVLCEHPNVRQAVVIDRLDSTGTKRLVAYMTTRTRESLDIDELRESIRLRLPEYMIPSALVTLENIPLTSNGKVDKRALPEPDMQDQFLARYVAPQTPTERVLAQIWADVLKLPQVGIEDNFFDLGGHSLLMMSITQAIKTQLGHNLTVISLFKFPTVAELAKQLDGHNAEEQSNEQQHVADRTAKRRAAAIVRNKDVSASSESTSV
jgi:amino acid adenylation domain-containing protein